MQECPDSLSGKVQTVIVEGAPQIQLVGECDLFLAPTVLEHLRELLQSGESRIIFDLQRVTFMDSSILRTFLVAREHAQPSGGEVVLLCRAGFVRRLLSLLEMDRVVRICTPEEWRLQTAAVH